MGNVHMEASQINYRGGETKMSVEEALKSTSGEAAAIAALQVAVGNLQTGKANMSVIAPAFNADTAYSVGDIVAYDGAAYRCTTAHEGEWDAEDFTATTISGEIASANGDIADLNGTKANQITIAPFFSAETAYDPGDLVYYNGLSYRCVNAHEGEWDADDFAAATIAGELDTLKSGLTEVNSNLTNVNSKLTITEPLTGISGIFSDKMGNMVTLHFVMNSITATSAGWYILADKLPAGLRPHRLVYFTGYDNDDSTHESSGAMQCMIDADGTVKIYAMSDNLTFVLRGTISYISD